MKVLITSISAVMCALLLNQFQGSLADLQANGCDPDWTDYENYCYKVVVGEVTANIARSLCQGMGSAVSSVWSQAEKVFIMSLWQFPYSEQGFLWLGLRGTAAGDWVFDDQSPIKIKQGEPRSHNSGHPYPQNNLYCALSILSPVCLMLFYAVLFNRHDHMSQPRIAHREDNDRTWSIFDDMPGIPAATPTNCIALRSSGAVAFLDCSLNADMYVCKKELPKVFKRSAILNNTNPCGSKQIGHVQIGHVQIGHVQLFERILPPTLTSLPDDSSLLVKSAVATEVGCAFRCYSVPGCLVFQVLCQSQNNCRSYQCMLYANFSG